LINPFFHHLLLMLQLNREQSARKSDHGQQVKPSFPFLNLIEVSPLLLHQRPVTIFLQFRRILQKQTILQFPRNDASAHIGIYRVFISHNGENVEKGSR